MGKFSRRAFLLNSGKGAALVGAAAFAPGAFAALSSGDGLPAAKVWWDASWHRGWAAYQYVYNVQFGGDLYYFAALSEVRPEGNRIPSRIETQAKIAMRRLLDRL